MNRILTFAVIAILITLVACGGGMNKQIGGTPNDATVSLTASVLTITTGQSTTLTWNCSNTKRVTLNGVIVMPTGTETVSPTVSTVYNLSATAAPGANGASTSVTITVDGVPPPPKPIVTFTATPPTIVKGSSSLVAWNVTNATSVMIDGVAVDVSGSESVSPNSTENFTLMADGPGGSTEASLTLTVTAASPLATLGRWTTLGTTMPINPIHAALLTTGKILVVSGSGNYNKQTTFYAGVLDPSDWSFAQQQVDWDMFCNGMVALPDGKILINGGTLAYGTAAPVGQPDIPFKGLATTSLFDPATELFDYTMPPTAHGRWYPTLTELPDGRVMTFSGLEEDGATNNYTVEIFDHKTNTWGTDFPANTTPRSPDAYNPELYPRVHLLPSEQVYYSGPTTCNYALDLTSMLWNETECTIYGRGTGEGAADRTYGSSVLLPLVPEKGYNPVVFIMGGDNPAQKTTEFIDLGNVNIRAACPDYAPCFEQGAPMSQARVESEGVLLPNGKVLAFSGSAMDETASSASLKADMYDYLSNTMTPMAPNAVVRLYHNVALLMPDASIWLAGGNPVAGTFENRMERYEPPYLFNADGSYATRPQITASPTSVTYGQTFAVTTDTTSIAYVEIMKNGSSTHSFDMEQRFVGLTFTQTGNTLTITAPPSTDAGSGSGIAPPGYYMLFLMSANGVPSVAAQIQVLGNGLKSAASSMAGRFQMLATPANLKARVRVPRSVTESPLKVRSMGGMNHN